MNTIPQARQEVLFKQKVDPAHMHADACLVCCIDPRWWNVSGTNKQSTIEEFRRRKHWKFVPLTEAGGIKVLVSNDPADLSRKNVLLQRIEQELDLHMPAILALSVHRDCGGYGYTEAFGNDFEKENQKLCDDLRAAKHLCEERFKSRVRVECYIFDDDGVEEVLF